MEAKLKWTIDPIKQTVKLQKGMRNKVIRIAMNKASAVVKAAVISNAPRRYGYLGKSIRIRLKNYRNKAVWVSVVGPKSDFVRRKGKYKRGVGKGTPITHRPSNYARLLEHGTTHAHARPFLKPALSATRSQFMSTLTQSISDQVAAVLDGK